MLTDDQLKAMEASAPLLVAEVRRLRQLRVSVLMQAELMAKMAGARVECADVAHMLLGLTQKT